MFESNRGILLYHVPIEYIYRKIRDYPVFKGKKKPVTLGVSNLDSGWVLVGIPSEMPRYDFHNLACWFFGESDDLEPHASDQDPDVPAENVVVVLYTHETVEKTYYAIAADDSDSEDSMDIIFHGRRDDGKGVKISVIEDSVKLKKSAFQFTSSTLEYLSRRGVPNGLMPGPNGFRFHPTDEIQIEVNT